MSISGDISKFLCVSVLYPAALKNMPEHRGDTVEPTVQPLAC